MAWVRARAEIARMREQTTCMMCHGYVAPDEGVRTVPGMLFCSSPCEATYDSHANDIM